MLVGCHGSSLSLSSEIVCEGESQGAGIGRPTTEADDHDMKMKG